MVMADIAFDGCVVSYWVLGLQALLPNCNRDGYNLTVYLAICGRQTKKLAVLVVKSHMMSHVITVHPSHVFNDVLPSVSTHFHKCDSLIFGSSAVKKDAASLCNS